MDFFNPKSSSSQRALQAWVILVSVAMNRQTLTYLDLSRMMFRKDAAGVLDKILGHIANLCEQYELPPLTAIVVGKGRGTPGKDIPVDLKNIDQLREQVYQYDWYNLHPPKIKEMKAAYKYPAKGN